MSLLTETARVVAEIEALARTSLARHIRIADEEHVNREMLRDLSDLAGIGRFYPADCGGSGDGTVNATRLCMLREGLARVSSEFSNLLATQIGGFYLAAIHADERLRQHWVPRIVAGEAICAVALTEPETGSDVAAISLRAERTGSGWRLNGVKNWIMKAPDADVYTVFARTSGTGGHQGISAFVVPADTPGFKAEPVSSLWPGRLGHLRFDDVLVGDDAMVGPPDAAFRMGMGIFDAFRPSVGAHVVGLAQAALEASIAYAGKRQAFGQPIGRFQAIAHLLAEMDTRICAARLMVYEAAATYDSGDLKRAAPAAARAKLYASRMCHAVIDDALQIHGAAGMQRGHLIEHLYREIRPARIYEGTDQIQREIIARNLLPRRSGAETVHNNGDRNDPET